MGWTIGAKGGGGVVVCRLLPTCGLHMLAFMAVKAGTFSIFSCILFWASCQSEEIAGKLFSLTPGLIKIGHKLWA